MVTGDSSYIKKINRSLILRKIIEHGFISRADLSKITGLNKATVSVQVADLLHEELIYETQVEHHSIGRRPIMISINEDAGYVLGVDLDYKSINYTISNLKGKSVYECNEKIETEDYQSIMKTIIGKIKEYQLNFSDRPYGVVNAVIGIHGTVNKQDGSIRFNPRYKWVQKNIKEELQKELSLPIFVENNANLSAYAEKVYKHHHSNNLLTIILTSGIGSGMIIDGDLQKGFHGYAGEMGHMIIFPNGDPCRCGNHGCWELYASEPSLLKKLETELQQTNLTIPDIENLLKTDHIIVKSFIDRYLQYVSIGLNNIINLYNPETIVINSRLLKIYPGAVEKLRGNLISSVSEYGEIVLSDLGNHSCVLGACALGIQHFLDVDNIRISLPEAQVLKEESPV
ncbi:ROK family transcriptional regulator [Bacillus timonensis]|uniref:ROK family transcriptional regulator n=1 Tax=Bacillus timonensis TaxID=1033734 RepID=A0A4S3PTY7_9BACI|nr:ROK family transcriptional regulator [Bacillus timonensis]THE12835.1 ROK family transcriptional regulator [Bacillus timonensis]